MTRKGAAGSATTCTSCFDLDGARRRGDVRPFVGPHPGERWLADAQPQEQISFERQSLCQRHFGRVADETFDIGDRLWRVRREATRDLHRSIESLAADGLVH